LFGGDIHVVAERGIGMKRWAAASAVVAAAALAVGIPAVAGAEPTQNRILPITYDCGSAGTFVLEGHQNNFQPQGRLDGKMVKVSWVWTEVASFGSSGFIIGEWDPPKAPNLTMVGCEAHYLIPGDPNDPFDDLSVAGDITIWVPTRLLSE
jgi:hypothetical protein